MAIFPQNGRVVIIDNDINEAQPLIKTLSKNNIRFSYFSGDPDQFPKDNLCDIRFLFLDLQLVKGEQNPKSVASTLCGVLEKFVSINNCPYVLLLWSKQGDIFFKPFRSAAENDVKLKKPIQYIDLKKSEYFTLGEKGWELNDDEEKILKLIENEIIKGLSSKHSFHLFTHWENLLNDSSKEIINSFSSISESSEESDKKMWSIIRSLAEAHSGKQLKISERDKVIQKALITFNGILSDRIEKNIKLLDYPNKIPDFSKMTVDDNEYCAQINTRLLIDEHEIQVVPGNIYLSQNIEIKEKILEKCIDPISLYDDFTSHFAQNQKITELIAKTELFDPKGKLNKKYLGDFYKFRDCCFENYFSPQCSLVFCEVSPSCDYSQKRWEMHRIIYGLKMPGKQICSVKEALFLYKTPMFSKNIEYYSFVFDLRFITGMEQRDLKEKKPILRIRHELLVDLQSKIAGHINRPGVTSLPDINF